jgi:hypothetical protein
LLRKETGENIIVSPVLQNEMAPDIVMRHVTIEGVMYAIEVASGLYATTADEGNTGHVVWCLTPQHDMTSPNPTWAFRAAPNDTNEKICRVFKASAKEKLASPQLDQLLANISDAARKVCEVKARAQGRAAAETPVIEAHAGTGTLLVAGTESDVQIVGQLIQAMGGEVVPRTSSVTPLNGRKIFDTRAPLVTPQGRLTRSGSPDGTNDLEDMREQLEAARNQVNNLQTQLDLLRQQQPPTAK